MINTQESIYLYNISVKVKGYDITFFLLFSTMGLHISCFMY